MGVIAKKNYRIELNSSYNKDMEIFLPIQININSINLHLLAIWNFYSVAKQGPYQGKTGDECVEFAALEYYSKFLQSENSLIVGDWNSAPTFGPKKIADEFYKINSIINNLKLTSLYHHLTKEVFGKESSKTYKSVRGQKQHMLDYIHASPSLTDKILDFKITPVDEVVKSDHAVLCVDFNI